MQHMCAGSYSFTCNKSSGALPDTTIAPTMPPIRAPVKYSPPNTKNSAIHVMPNTGNSIKPIAMPVKVTMNNSKHNSDLVRLFVYPCTRIIAAAFALCIISNNDSPTANTKAQAMAIGYNMRNSCKFCSSGTTALRSTSSWITISIGTSPVAKSGLFSRKMEFVSASK